MVDQEKNLQQLYENDDNDILIYSNHIEVSQSFAERFVRILKSKIYKRITANIKISCRSYLNILVGEYDYTYHNFIGKKPVDIDYFALTEKIELSHKALKFKVLERVRINKYKNIFNKSYIKN